MNDGAGDDFPNIIPLGLDGMLVRFADTLSDSGNRAALAFRGVVDGAGIRGIRETSTSLASTFIAFDPVALSHDRLHATLRELLAGRDWSDAPLPGGRTRWTVPVCFEGACAPQLADAAALAGVSPDRAVRDLTARPLRALALGYAPGQAYLGTLDANWNLDRQSALTRSVPLGAVIVAVRQVIMFATSGPTGWRQVGLTRFRCFRPDHGERPIPLAPGDEVRLRAVSEDEMQRLAGQPDAGATSEALA
ncbi:allophanate hydrolase family protein [Oceaniovalibus guishaninsula JLT2003]|uniref:Allophanate hydrolase family protein n=1 Tax=Oceaniovalibus guishaninsula JLT2003 TaxID=1231392 RepID=K2HCM7_9RHOB|nr:carboxyltransferase domain-containing protein [Oceaniovalibus guishaninsula]EKE44362.1 allophanate hydrolase family protein [Oceaniovalibus guishaninsula JLT2003]